MKIKFKKGGLVGLYYGIDGTMEVTEGQVSDVSEKHAAILIKDGIATEAKKAQPIAAPVIEEKAEVEVETVIEPVIQPIKKTAKKSGRSKKNK
tara:strand:- start:2862 stop:3140 length:279 start_codon:yes stop_codon:yes gene_type:complete